MSSLRIKNVIRNVLFSYFDLIISGTFSFLSRWIIVFVFSEKYLGLSSLFSSIFQVLCVAELGFASSIVYNLYKPIAENDTKKVCEILNYFRKVYWVVGSVVLTLGLIILPFIKYLIKDDIPDDLNIYILYILFLANTCIGYYFYAYKISLLDVLQRLDLIKKINSVISIVGFVLQLISLLILKNYYLYAAIPILNALLGNCYVGYISKKEYPQFYCNGKIDSVTKNSIRQRVKGLLISNISLVTYTTFDSIILSLFFGLNSVAIYSNYLLIFNTISNLIVVFRRAIQSSVGNSIAVEKVEKNYKDLLILQFIFSMLATWCVVCLLNLCQPFMYFWMGKDNMLTYFDVVLLCAWFYIGVASHSFFLYLAGYGLWWEVRMPYLLSAIVNIVMNIVLGKLLGITGIIISTFVSSFIFGSIWQCMIVFKHYFKCKFYEFIKKQLLYTLVCLLICLVSFIVCLFIPFKLFIVGLIVRLLISTILSVLIMYLLFKNYDVYKSSKNYINEAKKLFIH